MDVIEGRVRRLIVHFPVRHGKSEMVSTYLPAFCLGSFPDEGFLAAMHTANVVGDYGGRAREILELYGRDLYDVAIDPSSRAKTNWKIARRQGRYIGRGVRGGFPSRGGSRFAIDDPTKTPQEAASDRAQSDLEEWYRGIARSRLTGTGAVILIMSRWQQLDLAGRLMRLWENESLDYRYVHFPAIADRDGDALGRQRGDALCPKMFTADQLADIRKEIGEDYWMAQFEGNPLPPRGRFFDVHWLRRFELRTMMGAPHLIALGDQERGELDRAIPLEHVTIRRMQYVDLAATLPKPGEDPDYFVCMTVAIDRRRKDVYILDVFRDRIEAPDQIPQLVHLFRAFRPYRQKIEAVAFQRAQVQYARNEGLAAEPIERGKGAGDKQARAEYAANRMKTGRVFVPLRAHWLADFENELRSFPRGHDDQIDCLADACADLLNPAMDIDRDTMAAASV